jgi:hypothetical protein
VYILKIQYVQDRNRPQHYLKQGQNFKKVVSLFCLAMTQTALNNLRIRITSCEIGLVYVVSLGTQRKGLMKKKRDQKFSRYYCIPLNSVGSKLLKYHILKKQGAQNRVGFFIRKYSIKIRTMTTFLLAVSLLSAFLGFR